MPPPPPPADRRHRQGTKGPPPTPPPPSHTGPRAGGGAAPPPPPPPHPPQLGSHRRGPPPPRGRGGAPPLRRNGDAVRATAAGPAPANPHWRAGATRTTVQGGGRAPHDPPVTTAPPARGGSRSVTRPHIGFYDVARSQNSVAGLPQKPPRSRFLRPPQAFLAHFARFVPILCAVKQIQEAQSANRNHILLL